VTKAYILKDSDYVRYDVEVDQSDAGYPKALTNGWKGLDGTGFESDIDSVLDLGTGKAYLFKGDQYLRVDQQTNAVDDGYPLPIADNWGGLAEAGFADSINAAINWGDGKAFLFRGRSYVRYDIATDHADEGYPASIAEGWGGLGDVGFGDSIDAAVAWGNGKVFFFKADSYVRYDIATDHADEGYPASIAEGWAGLVDVGFADSINAVWVKLDASTSHGPRPVVTGQLAPGDHVWYFNGQISTDLDIPRQSWFPGSTSPTDYQGHGDEIFNFVIHANGEIRRGRPHMRSREGSFAWLNNNPGNLTGKAGGTDFGQYRDKFNWHHFLIFPTFDTGFAAIAAFLRGPTYRDLNILDAFRRYAPASDGNDPDSYASAVASAAGVSTSTLVRDLSDEQMRFMQDKITQIEGSVPGVVLGPDSPELPEEIRSRL
jgi:hypothetical protein